MRRPDHATVRLWLTAVGVAALVATMVASTTGVVILLNNSDRASRERQAQLSQAKQVKVLAQLLVECTTPPEQREPPVKAQQDDCYQRSVARTGAAVQTLGEVTRDYSVIAAACGAAHPGDVPATRRCFTAAITKETQ